MASINKLSIRGVRAFSPEDQEQVLEFYFPITIILGQNGCGKTTIIESLKYAITGSFPPGCGRSGNAFVHDPKAIGQTIVKANVKLRFTSRSSQEMVVVRSMELTQKKTKATFKQLDGVLRMMDPSTGERVNLSHKCSELDKQIPQLLGVSKAILEHVVFCHQEDASWPLMDSAVLKKRFDDIFDSTKYSKALKIFRDTEKDFLSKVKDLKADVAGLGSHKHAAEGFRAELAEQNEQIAEMDEEKKKYSEKIEQLEQELADLSQIIAKVDEINYEIDSRKNSICQEELVVQKQCKMVEEDMTETHTVMDLKEMLRDFHKQMSTQKSEMEDLEAQCQQIHRDIEGLRQDSMGLTSRTGKLTAEKEAHEKRLRERYSKMERIAQTYTMDLTQMSQTQGNSSIAASLSQSMTMDDEDDSATFATITAEDMQGFFDALEQKEADLNNTLKAHRERYREEEDKITQVLTELGGKLQAVENDKARLMEEKSQAEVEIRDMKLASGPTRVRKNDVEDHKRKAIQAAEERDQQNKDPRRSQIQIEIRQIEETMDKIKRKIDDETGLLGELRHTADAQNEMVNLKLQCDKDLEGLDEFLREEGYSLKKFSIDVPDSLPSEEDEDGDQLIKVIESMSQATREKFDSANDNLSRITDDVTGTQKIVSEKTALLAGSQRKLKLVENEVQKLGASVEDVKQVVDELRRHETDIGETLTANEDQPRQLLEYLSERLQKVEDDAPNIHAPKVAQKVLKRLSKLAKVCKPGTKEVEKIECPCCRREMVDNEIAVFVETLEKLQAEDSPLVRFDPGVIERYESLKTTYQNMRKTIESKVDSLRDYRRLTGEVAELEKEIKRLQDDVTHYTSTLRDQSEQKDDAQSEVNDVRELLETVRSWSNEANRIAERKLQIKSKKRDLSHSVTDSSRDLRTVERSIAELREEKETLSTKINRLNKEVTDINRRISEMSTRASNLEKLAREKEEKYAEELKAIERKKELTSRIQQIGDEEKKLVDQVAPIQSKMRKKDQEKQRTRSLANDEDQKLVKILSSFDGDVQTLRSLVKQIDDYTSSTKAQELDGISAKVAKIDERIEVKKVELKDIEPTLESTRRAVDDQERRKKQLQQNVDILEARERVVDLENEVEKLEAKRDEIEGYNTASQQLAAASKRKEKLVERRARADGIWKAQVEQIRALQRKLSQPEYKDVHEQYRVAMIKHITTKTAAEDLKKYGNALDKALLQFHGVKIQEINKIIRELWMMTYKGEDITNIEIQSGQEAGSKAAKSYNYRVVMTKGGSKMDMRGRCSAGQRVLTSIVIRLALAETFGVNCGVCALDEPTVNLDYENKKGLAVALAHIVASRSQQRNFQLIMITHDEEFVGMMKTELSSLTGFSMPEKFFQVCREEAADGKFYSKINQRDWDELL